MRCHFNVCVIHISARAGAGDRSSSGGSRKRALFVAIVVGKTFEKALATKVYDVCAGIYREKSLKLELKD